MATSAGPGDFPSAAGGRTEGLATGLSVAFESTFESTFGTAFGTGITDAAKLHLAASTLIIKDAVEFTEIYLHDNLLAAPHDRDLRLPLKDLRVTALAGVMVS